MSSTLYFDESHAGQIRLSRPPPNSSSVLGGEEEGNRPIQSCCTAERKGDIWSQELFANRGRRRRRARKESLFSSFSSLAKKGEGGRKHVQGHLYLLCRRPLPSLHSAAPNKKRGGGGANFVGFEALFPPSLPPSVRKSSSLLPSVGNPRQEEEEEQSSSSSSSAFASFHPAAKALPSSSLSSAQLHAKAAVWPLKPSSSRLGSFPGRNLQASSAREGEGCGRGGALAAKTSLPMPSEGLTIWPGP